MNCLTEMLADYNTGKFSVKMLSKRYGFSVGKTYYLLRDAGCTFTRNRRTPVTQEERIRRSACQKGKVISEELRRMISERNSCNFNGLNGYGHTKKHNRGYVLAYVPKHPSAHKDGYVQLHTVIMERHLGRYLKKDEVVHHINHVRDDNRIENLKLMNRHEHMSMHMKERHSKRGSDLLTA